tara:strand:- start:18728 stop:19315 length:588 start_codon:yes stop_codon:yes gene_type:complete
MDLGQLAKVAGTLNLLYEQHLQFGQDYEDALVELDEFDKKGILNEMTFPMVAPRDWFEQKRDRDAEYGQLREAYGTLKKDWDSVNARADDYEEDLGTLREHAERVSLVSRSLQDALARARNQTVRATLKLWLADGPPPAVEAALLAERSVEAIKWAFHEYLLDLESAKRLIRSYSTARVADLRKAPTVLLTVAQV